MPKLQNEAIRKEDLLEYIESYSDFSFELSVLKMLRDNDINCEHGGLYEDPVTGKSREFDIRATKTISQYRIRLAIECKNIKENFPVLVSCIPRHAKESYHQIAIVGESKSDNTYNFVPLYKSRAQIINLENQYSIYKCGEPIGKSTAQIGRGLDKKITANDGELYDKWSQSLSSSTDLVSTMYWDGDENDDFDLYFSTVIPIVVIPNGRLWQTVYDESGNRTQYPRPSDRCSCFVDKDYSMGTEMAKTRMWISHIEIMTFNGLRSFLNSYIKTEEGMKEIFPQDGIMEEFEKALKA